IVRASLNTSCTFVVLLNLIPPFPGPVAVLSMTRTPFIPVSGSYTLRTFSGPHSSAAKMVSSSMKPERRLANYMHRTTFLQDWQALARQRMYLCTQVLHHRQRNLKTIYSRQIIV